MTQYTTLARKDVRTFDEEAWSIIDDAQDAGWLFNMSTKGHAIGRAPGGEATISVSRDSLRGRSGRNARAALDRWRHAQVRQVKGVEQILDNLTTGPARERARGQITQIAEQYRDDGRMPDAAVQVMKIAMEDDAIIDSILRLMSATPPTLPGFAMIDTHAEDNGEDTDYGVTDTTRAWHVAWVVYDPSEKHVIGFGGPEMTDEYAQQIATAAPGDGAVFVTTPTHRPRVAKPDAEPDAEPKVAGTCPVCGKSFEDLVGHRDRDHQDMEPCPRCGEWFKSGLGMRAHQRAHEAKTACPQCGRMLTPGTSYAQHVRAHERAAATMVAAEAMIEARDAEAAGADRDGSTPAADVPVKGGRERPRGNVPRTDDAVEAVMAILTELDDLRAANPQGLREQVAALTAERDAAVARAEQAETTLAMLREALAMK